MLFGGMSSQHLSRAGRATTGWLPCILLLAACSSDVNARGGEDSTAGSNTGLTPPEPDPNVPEAPGADGGNPGGLPGPMTCRDRELPSSFVDRCSACHSTTDEQNSRYPDLFAFEGSANEFVAQVRKGGGVMPAFSPSEISDEDLARSFAFFSTEPREQIELGAIKPLFDMPEPVVPITFMRDDGVLVTRAAGRVRQRHELEGTFGPFGPHYFEHRSYGFIVEDFTPRGESRVRVTYLPIATPEQNTNFRCWKIYGDGNVFHTNLGMTQDAALPDMTLAGKPLTKSYVQDIAPYAFAQAQEQTRNAREGRELKKGDLFEFEFGVFIEPSAVQSNTRTSYYSDTFRYQVGLGGLTASNADTSGQPGPEPLAQQGGTTTGAWLYAEPETSFEQLALNVQHEHVQTFLEGRRLFHTDFETGKHAESGNPVFAEQMGKAGPLLTTTSCVTCHDKNGGGRPLESDLGRTSSMVFKLYDAGNLGNQLQLGEGQAKLASTAHETVMLVDGSAVQLTRNTYAAVASDGRALRHSARVARRLVGMGLLEALSETTLLGRADPLDCDRNGISGRANYVNDPLTGELRVGRFGWRAEKVSVAHQVADAAAADLGVFTSIIKGHAGEVELSDDELRKLTTYMRLLAVPAQREAADPTVKRGQLLFRSVGCADCHVSDAVTAATHPFVELRGQAINPYTDLLLHDLGPDLADESAEPGDRADGEPASASEWRTAPLWGLGIANTVQGYTALLHDGRAKSVLEAVLWHGGEAENVRKRFAALSGEDRAALLRFVESL